MRLLSTLLLVAATSLGHSQSSFKFNFRSDLFRIQDFKVGFEKSVEGWHPSIRALSEAGAVDQRIAGDYTFSFRHESGEALDMRVTFDKGLGSTTEALPEAGTWFVSYLVTDLQQDGSETVVDAQHKLYRISDNSLSTKTYHVPLWQSILPPLLAILLALLLKEVIISLVAGIWLGAFLLSGFDITRFFHSIYEVVTKYIAGAIADPGHVAVIVFSLLIGGMVAIVSRNGGMAGVVDKLTRYASSSRNSQFVTWLLGIAIFFDDYANSLIVGNTMRPVTDRFRVSREKLAYIVDSTAAPVSAVALVTTWIGTELGYIGDATASLGIAESSYSIFLHSLEFAMYPLLTIAFVFMVVWMKRDFGSMYRAEARARSTGTLYDTRNEPTGSRPVDDSLRSLDPIQGIRLRWQNALYPVVTVVAVVIVGLLMTGGVMEDWDKEAGFFANLSTIIGNADSYKALLWGSLSGVGVAIIMTLVTRTLSFRYTIETLMDGFKTMLPAVVILVLAWSVADITKEMHTADFLTELFGGAVSPFWMPFLTFILAALISFSTGSSWSTMAILFPIILPTTWALCAGADLGESTSMGILYNVTACVLGGSVFGDHCSPISDTTVLSSLASSCNHIDHVRTQMPYALLVAVVSLVCGTLLTHLGVPWWLLFPIGVAVLYGFLKLFGKRVDNVTVTTG
jgi:Na+/H+ antiporter NhaC